MFGIFIPTTFVPNYFVVEHSGAATSSGDGLAGLVGGDDET